MSEKDFVEYLKNNGLCFGWYNGKFVTVEEGAENE